MVANSSRITDKVVVQYSKIINARLQRKGRCMMYSTALHLLFGALVPEQTSGRADSFSVADSLVGFQLNPGRTLD